jgi:hypothetical protein
MPNSLYINANNTLITNSPVGVTLTLGSINGTFNPGDVVYQQDSSNTNATVVSFSAPTLVVSGANSLFSTSDNLSASLIDIDSGANASIIGIDAPPAIANLSPINLSYNMLSVSGANTTNLAYVTTYSYDAVNVALTNTYTNSTSTYTNTYNSVLTSNSLTIGNSVLTSNSLNMGNASINNVSNTTTVAITNKTVAVTGANTSNLSYSATYSYNTINLAFNNTYTNSTSTYTNTYNVVLNSNTFTINNTSNNILTLIANDVNIAFGNSSLVQSVNVNSNSVTISTSEPNYLSSGASANTRTRTLVVNPDNISGNVTISNSTISNTTYFAINANGITVANSTVSFTFIPPTAAQKASGNYFLAANGAWTQMTVP